jgi:hypothetical protein
MKDWQASIGINFIFAAYESGLLKALSQPCDRRTLVEKLQIKRLTPLPDIDEIKSLLEHCGFSKIKIHQFMPGSSFLGIAAYRG